MATPATEKMRALSDEALVHQELGLERKLLETTFRHKTGQLEDTSQMRQLRRDIARARTLQRERERDQGLGKNALRDVHRSTFKPGQDAAAAEGEAGAKGFLRGFVDKMGAGE